MLDRRNILDLIGKNRGKYHSCVITCYSLDFSFFEERVLPTLRLANIKNVNILADGHYLEMVQESTTGKEFKHNKTYNFQPVYETGVFHPKIILLTGVKHGLLIIGSGNITSSGLSTNDEIWGAFHLDNLENENAPLFGNVWEYLQPFLNKSLGFIPQKIEWMRKHSPWLAELPTISDWIKLDSIGAEIKFIGNTTQSNTFSELSSLLPTEQAKELTVISPYYDKSGKLIMELKNRFQPKSTKCIVDENSGLLPTEIEPDSQINFYSWAECKADYNDIYNRLHAKIFHFTYSKEEYLLLGSANATMAAMGSSTSKAANGEAGVLLKRNNNEKTWLEELKINIPSSSIELQEKQTRGIGESSVPKINYKYRVLYAELRSNEITIYLNKESSGQVSVNVVNRDDITIQNTIKQVNGDIIVISLQDPDGAFKLYVQEDLERISNFCIIHRLEALLRCNPDPKQEKLDTLLEEDFEDGEGITDLLQFVDYNWADEEEGVAKTMVAQGGFANKKPSDIEEVKHYEVLNSEDFNKVSAESLLKQSGELSNSTVKIAEFLSLYSAGVFTKEESFSESEEQKLFEDEEQLGEGGVAENSARKRTQGSKEKSAMIKYFNKLNEIYTKKLQGLYGTGVLTEIQSSPITIRSISSFLIAIHLIQLKYGKRFTVLTNEKNESGDTIIKEETYINAGSKGDSVESVKGFLLNILGKYLLLSNEGIKTYEFEILNQKILRSNKQLLQKSLMIILNVPWKENERLDRDLLILNCLHFTLGEKLLIQENYNELTSKLDEYKLKSSFLIPDFHDQLIEFKENLLPKYMHWLKSFSDKESGRKKLIHPTSDLKYGNIIFNSKIGFNTIRKVNPGDIRFRLQLSRAGFPFIDGEFDLKDVQFGTQCILFQ